MSMCSTINRKHPDMLTRLSYCMTMPIPIYWPGHIAAHAAQICHHVITMCLTPWGQLAGASMGHLPLYPMGLVSMAAVSFSITIPNEFHFNKTQRLCSNWLRSPNSLLTIFLLQSSRGVRLTTDLHLEPISRMVEVYLFSWHSA
jgi:hypothetical protein